MRGVAEREARVLGAGHGVTRHERGVVGGGGEHGALHRRDVGDRRPVVRRTGQHAGDDVVGDGQRRGHHDDVGAGQCLVDLDAGLLRLQPDLGVGVPADRLVGAERDGPTDVPQPEHPDPHAPTRLAWRLGTRALMARATAGRHRAP
jgi:hypothetical protein